ncbi:hypothetical protein ES703_77257 [subsurface metagenome]
METLTMIAEKFNIGLLNAWWYPIVYGIANIAFMIAYPKKFRLRMFTIPKVESRFLKAMFFVSLFFFSRGLIIYSIFVPLVLSSPWFWPGTIVFVIGLGLYAVALYNFALTSNDKPVTSGVYRLTRHPMQIMSIIMWIGIGIASANLIIIASSIALALISNFSFIAQEQFCMQTYGEYYQSYMKKTPRYLFFV